MNKKIKKFLREKGKGKEKLELIRDYKSTV